MAESRRYLFGNQLDIKQILLEAQTRWLRPAEICEILRNYQNFRISSEPHNKPPSGSIFLYDRKVLRYFRKDGHNWRKKRDGKTVKEAHERLKAGSVDVLHCYYAHGEENQKFQRRTYWMLEEDYLHIVLVHYLEVQSNRAGSGRSRDVEEVPTSSQNSSPVSSSVLATYSQLHSQTTDTVSLNSAQASDYEDAESDNHQASSAYHYFLESQQHEDRPSMSLMESGLLTSLLLSGSSGQHGFQGKQPAIPGLDIASFDQQNGGRDRNSVGFGLDFEPQKQLDSISWENVLESWQSESYKPTFSSIMHPANMGITSKQENILLEQLLANELNNKSVVGDGSNPQEKWQVISDDSSEIYKWTIDQMSHLNSTYDLTARFDKQRDQYMNLHNKSDPMFTYSEQPNGHLVQNDPQLHLSDEELGGILKSDLEDNLNRGENLKYSSTDKHPLLGNLKTDELKKVDSFTRWMSDELGGVEETNTQSSSALYWDTVQNENAVDGSSLAPQVQLDSYLLNASLSKEQLFSIIDFSPNWAYTDSETKVLIMGKFLRSQQDVMKFKWSCMFGEVEVPLEVLGDGVLSCHAPLCRSGRVPFYVTCSNRLACSEVREFEFRVKTRDFDITDLSSSSTNDILLHVRLGELLSLGTGGHPKSLSNIIGDNSNMSSKISSLMKEDADEWLQMLKLITKEFSPGEVKDQLLQKMLKEKLHEWLLVKVAEDGKGPCVFDKEGQGVLHLTAALGYDWAISPIIASGVSINFRDVNGWTALHWAASCGRERTVAALVSLGAATGALTDPSSTFPSGRTPADLASSNGHKGIAGYLAETSLTSQLSTLALKDANDCDLPETSTSKAIQTASERFITPDVPDASLNYSLTAVRNAIQAAGRIHQVYRVQSFQRKKLIEYGNDKIGMSNERALSLISVKTSKFGQHDEPVHTAAIRIQNKFRGWKGRKEFLLTRQRIVTIQAHVRGHQVRKQYKKIVWSVGIVEKAILRWRRKGSGFRKFRNAALIQGLETQTQLSKQDDYDFLKIGRKQAEERSQIALARVKSMVQYPEARDQYRRLRNVESELREAKDMEDRSLYGSIEVVDYGDEMIDLDALLDDDAFMSTAL